MAACMVGLALLRACFHREKKKSQVAIGSRRMRERWNGCGLCGAEPG